MTLSTTVNPIRSSRAVWTLTGAAFGAAMLLDITADALGGARPAHLAIEVVLMAAVLWGGSWVGRGWQRHQARLESTIAQASASAEQASASATQWKEAATKLEAEAATLRLETAALRSAPPRLNAATVGLSAVIDAQFIAWSLSPAESEVAMLLLKGLSLKETAEVRGTSERTTRKQARAVYRKSGLAGRAELSAWFLEDLLGCDDTADTADTSLTE
ncbi:MAG: DNA-binding CsgD family transcriptional regulator [Myxococcota bacterium]|jgi:DNA-binding CsgD family transcriptional regulator